MTSTRPTLTLPTGSLLPMVPPPAAHDPPTEEDNRRFAWLQREDRAYHSRKFTDWYRFAPFAERHNYDACVLMATCLEDMPPVFRRHILEAEADLKSQEMAADPDDRQEYTLPGRSAAVPWAKPIRKGGPPLTLRI